MLPARTKATLFLALIFLCGALSGGVGVNLWERMRASAQSSQPGSSAQTAPSPQSRRAVEHFTQRLQLTPDQAEKLLQILEATRGAYELHELEIESIRQQGNAQIREILNDEQKAKFDQLVARAEERRHKGKRR